MAIKTEKSNSGFWTFLGKLTAIFTVVLLLFQVWKLIFPDENHKGKSTGEYSEFLVPQNVIKTVDDFQKLKTALSVNSRTNVFKGEINNADTIVTFFDSLPISSNRSIYESELGLLEQENNLRKPYTMWTVRIKNEGKSILEKLVLELGANGVFTFSKKDENKDSSGIFKDRIELGDLRPSYEIVVTCWTTGNYWFENEQISRNSRVTHQNGWFVIAFPLEAVGNWSWMIKNEFLLEMVLTLLIVFTLYFFLYQYYEIRRLKKEISLVKKENEISEAE